LLKIECLSSLSYVEDDFIIKISLTCRVYLYRLINGNYSASIKVILIDSMFNSHFNSGEHDIEKYNYNSLVNIN